MSTQNRLLDIAWVVPSVFAGSGGHLNIFRNIAYLSEFGHQNTIYCADFGAEFRSDRELQDYIHQNFVDTQARVVQHWNLQRCDVAIATHWSTAYAVHEFPHCSKKFYFVQDYEPYFHPMSLDYLRAENTYRLGFSCITLGRWLTHLLREKYDADADYFDFPVDGTTYSLRPGAAPNPRIVFYAQPEKPRRCFDLGIRVLEIVHRLHPEVEIVLFGSNSKSILPIGFPHTELGVISPRECAELYRSSRVGLILSASNPSLIVVEMMACGCPVVDLNPENNRFDYEPGTVSLADPTPEALAQAIIRLLEDENARGAQIQRALQMVSQRSYEQSARKVEALLLKGWITGRVSSIGDLHLDQFQSWAEKEAILDPNCAQTFRCTRDNFCEIDVFFANQAGNTTNNSIVSELWDAEENCLLATLKMPLSEIGNWKWHSFRFPVQPFSKGRSYRLLLRLDGNSGPWPRVLYTTKPAYAGGELFLAGQRTTGALKFKTYCAAHVSRGGVQAPQPSFVPHTSMAADLGPKSQGAPLSGTRAIASTAEPTQELFLNIINTLKNWKSRGSFPHRMSPYNLREAVFALTYPEAGMLVRMARFLLLIEHYWVWARVHARQGGLKAVVDRVRRRLRLMFRSA